MLIACVSSHAAQADVICTWVGFENASSQTKRMVNSNHALHSLLTHITKLLTKIRVKRF